MRNREVRFNIYFWLIYFLYEWLGLASVGDEFDRYFETACVLVPLSFVASFFTVKVLVPRFFVTGRRKEFWLYLLLSALVFTLARRGFHYFYIYPTYLPHALEEMPYLYWPKLLIDLVNIYLIVGLYAMFHFVRELYRQQQISAALKQDKVETELQLLKSQVHPHFMFNTLNNIYALAENGDPRTKDLIYRLSAFLSYNLYEVSAETVSLEKELEFIRNYIELERVRYDGELDISMNVFQTMGDVRISPMLLLPLVENALKHSLGDEDAQRWIRMDLTRDDDWLTIKIENSLVEDRSTGADKSSGLGLENLKKRLDILYPKAYELQLLEEEVSFMAILKIKTNR
ncbi:histidine kinase [Muricauda sp. NFXS6]|uniref:sensor histidine kinase n=1 Tax=Allomuricauda sp. NFXS6 TaxID=2819094 RepID=UPI0032DFB509